MQISDIFHNCPEEEQQEQEQQCNPKDLGNKFPRSKIIKTLPMQSIMVANYIAMFEWWVFVWSFTYNSAVSVSFFVFPCSKGHSVKAYLDI